MDTTTPLMMHVETPAYGQVCIDANDGFRYHADLLALQHVYCFPKDRAAWNDVSIDEYGLALVWSSRFEVHVDQVIGLAAQIEKQTVAQNA